MYGYRRTPWAAGAPFAFFRAAVGAEPTDDGVAVTRSSRLFDETAVDVFERRMMIDITEQSSSED